MKSGRQQTLVGEAVACPNLCDSSKTIGQLCFGIEKPSVVTEDIIIDIEQSQTQNLENPPPHALFLLEPTANFSLQESCRCE